MSTRIYWFRSDLRVHDHAGLRRAVAGATQLLPVYCHDPDDDQDTGWGFARVGPHRRRFLAAALADLHVQLSSRGSGLLELCGRPNEILPRLARAVQASAIVCESGVPPAPAGAVTQLREAGIKVEEVWFSSLLDPVRLPYALNAVPAHFTPFRQSVEASRQPPPAPLAAPAAFPPLPALGVLGPAGLVAAPGHGDEPGASAGARAAAWPDDVRSSFPYQRAQFRGGETAALEHVARYFAGPLPLSYKSTRNRLTGIETSTKFSPWLATGALSPRTLYAALKAYEARHGAGEGTYAIWFELLWRDFFRFLALRDHARQAPAPARPASLAPDAAAALLRWREGRTAAALVDAGMRELAATGYLSNRLRQLAASYLINELAVDPAAGAAWFAAQLLDFDPYSNDGNWRYIAGTGADPRGGRHFNVDKQTRDHDPDGQFRVLWGTA